MSILRNALFALLISTVPLAGFAGPVDINQADAATLAATITGVGARKAEAIVQYRQVHGPFKSLDDLLEVRGIGAQILERNRSRLTVGGARTSRSRAEH